jgi:ribosomal protein L37AE/L43A
MAHTIEPAASGRAKCRGCGQNIAKGELRLGARLPNPFVEGELTLWFHLKCAVYKHPQPFLDAAGETTETLDNRDQLEAEAKRSLEHKRLPRLSGAERAPTGRASCRSCREPIAKGTWRLPLVFYEEVEGRFQPAGFIHPKCAKEYFGTNDVMARIQHFSPTLEASDVEELRNELDTDTGEASPPK